MSATATPKGKARKPSPDETCDPAAIAELCNEAGVPTMTATLIREGVSITEARNRVDYVGHVKGVVAMAHKTMPAIPITFADEAIKARMPLAKVREEIFNRMAEADEALPLTTLHRAGAGGTDTPGVTTDASVTPGHQSG